MIGERKRFADIEPGKVNPIPFEVRVCHIRQDTLINLKGVNGFEVVTNLYALASCGIMYADLGNWILLTPFIIMSIGDWKDEKKARSGTKQINSIEDFRDKNEKVVFSSFRK